jgi:hypothetical protein
MRGKLVFLIAALAAGCGATTGNPEMATPTPTPTADPTPTTTGTATPTPTPGPAVSQYANDGVTCSTSVIEPLSAQLVAELDCLDPGVLSEMPASGQIDVTGIFDFLQTSAGSTLPTVVAARPGVTMQVTSALRTLPQQYLLYAWFQQGRCGIAAAATPGTSKHEGGLSLDLHDASSWSTAMQASPWLWANPSDPTHFDFTGSGTTDIHGESVMAFQRLWNLNNPGDAIAEDGIYGPMTGARVALTPSTGFAIGDECGNSPMTYMPVVEHDTPADPETCAL